MGSSSLERACLRREFSAERAPEPHSHHQPTQEEQLTNEKTSPLPPLASKRKKGDLMASLCYVPRNIS